MGIYLSTNGVGVGCGCGVWVWVDFENLDCDDRLQQKCSVSITVR